MKMPKYKRINITEKVMNEVIIHGGIPLRRGDVYKLTLESTGSAEAADMFAFGTSAKPVNMKPFTASSARKLFGLKKRVR